jgi:hypothetical protein
VHPGSLIDTDRYDLDDPKLAEGSRRQFHDEGVCILPGFLRRDAIASLVHECRALEPIAFHSRSSSTPYLTQPDPSRPEDHPARRIVHSSVEVVAYDQFPANSLLRALYEWDPLTDFVRRCLGLDELHRYGDPFGALNLSVMRDGDELCWHFDMADFVVSLAIQSSSTGGEFENAKQIRTSSDENFEAVAAVLDGRAPGLVRTEPMTPGTLMLFNGRWSMHRVTTIGGPASRYVALLAYDTKPGTDSSDELKLSRYGRLPSREVRA